ncbi:MAG: efflux RND transporter permease subunit [Thermaceae bacterium]|nr:efflux RND transporter permease subunit [Thermaceae bacterium]
MRDNPLVKFFVERFVFSTAAFLALVLFGLIAGSRLGVDLLPKFEIPVVAVSTIYAGAGPEEIESQVSRPIEDALSTLPNVDQIASQSSEGFSLVIVQFKYGTSVDQVANDVAQRVAGARGQLPKDAEAPVVRKFDPASQPILYVAVSAGGRDLREVANYVDQRLKPSLQLVPGVADAQLEGAPTREIQVLLDPWKIAEYSLTAPQVVAAIQASALAIPAGSQDQNGQRLLYTLRNTPRTPQDVANIVVDSNRGLKVSDFATVRDTSATPTSYTRLNGQPVILLGVRKTPDSNAVAVGDGIKKVLAETKLPPGYKAQVVGDTTTFISATVDDTLKEVVIVALVVSLVVLIFLGKLNSVFSVVIAIPITMAGALLVFGLLGFTYNIISLLAIIVAVGIVVDDSIVVAENIDRYRSMTYSLADAVRKGVREVLSSEQAGLLAENIERYQKEGLELSAAVHKATQEMLPEQESEVVADNITRLLNERYTLKEAVLKGATQVISAVSAATLSLLAVFLPISFLPGFIGQFFKEFGLGLAAAIFFSWLEALFFLTVRLAYLPDPKPPTWRALGGQLQQLPSDLRKAFTQSWRRPLFWVGAVVGLVLLLRIRPIFALGILLYPVIYALVVYLVRALLGFFGAIATTLHEGSEFLFLRLRDAYANALARMLPRSGWVLGVGFLAFLTIGLVAPKIPFNFTPQSDNGAISIVLTLPKGTALSETDAVVRQLEAKLLQLPEVKEVLATTGSSANALGSAPAERASLDVTLIEKSRRKNVFLLVGDIKNDLQPLLASRPEADLRVSAEGGGPGGPDFQYTLTAPTPELLQERTLKALQILRGLPFLANVTSSLTERANERVLTPNSAALEGTGITPNDLGTTLRIYNAGVEAAKLRQSGEEYPIIVKADPRLVPNQNALLSLPINSPTLRQTLPLSAVSSFQNRQSPATLARTNQAFSAGITANRAPGVTGGVFQYGNQIQAELKKQGVLSDGVSLDTQGGTAFIGDLASAAPIAFGLALLLNYLVIASQFNTFRYPLYLLLPVPLALVGAFWALYLFGAGLDIISVLGLVMLIGLVTKNAILLLDFAVREAREKPLYEALVEAGRLRLRPILMTTLTVLIISLPLIAGSGEGAEFRKPLGIIILGGVLTSTLLTLFIVPSAFYLFERRRFEKLRAAPTRSPDRAPAFGD